MNDMITITGNVATDPQHKHPEGGVSITTFRVASGHRRFDRQSGTWVDGETNWYNVSTYRGLADHAFQSLHKGDRVLLTGRLKIRNWETATKKGTSVEIDADAIGHDLLWGTTRFEKDQKERTPVDAPPQQEWSVPGSSEPVVGSTTEEWPVARIPEGDGDGEQLELELERVDAPF